MKGRAISYRSCRARRVPALVMLVFLSAYSVRELRAGAGTGTLFGSNYESGVFFTINTITGVGTDIGPADGWPALAVDPTTGIMYGARDSLFIVNPATGAATLVGSPGVGGRITALDFRGDGTLFASVNLAGALSGSGADHLAIINKATGAATVIGPYGSCTGVVIPSTGGGSCTLEGIEAIAFDNFGVLWAARRARGTAGLPGLYSVNSSTGAATFLRPILDAGGSPPSGGVVSLQFRCDGVLFGGTANEISPATDGGRLITINPATGLFSFVGTVAALPFDSLSALAFQSPCTGTPPVGSSLCGLGNPAPISGSTGAQGVLDPANTIPPDQQNGGLIWPPTAAVANIFLDTGQVLFTDFSNQLVGSATLPGASLFPPAFPEGKLHFTSVRLPAGKAVVIFASALAAAAFTSPLGVAPPALVLSCQDVILEAGSALAVGLGVAGAPIFGPTGAPVVLAGAFSGGGVIAAPRGGFGPRLGTVPAAGSLYPPLGGAGGNSGSSAITCGLGSVVCPSGGFGGGALVVAAAQKITVNGDIIAVGSNGVLGNTGAQGGGGGSVRLAAVLVEGIGTINTAGGLDANGSTRSADGPIEVQAFVQDLFSSGCATPTKCTTTPLQGKPVVKPIPENLPTIRVTRVGLQSLSSPTGSLTAPDVTLPLASTVQSVQVEVLTTGVPVGTTTLNFRAVGTDGSVAEFLNAPVVASTLTPCSGGTGACVNLSLKPGVAYQIVVTPTAAFALARNESGPVPLAEPILAASVAPGIVSEPRLSQSEPRPRGSGAGRVATEQESHRVLEQWGRAFGVEVGAPKKVARLRGMATEAQRHREE